MVDERQVTLGPPASVSGLEPRSTRARLDEHSRLLVEHDHHLLDDFLELRLVHDELNGPRHTACEHDAAHGADVRVVPLELKLEFRGLRASPPTHG